MNRRLTIKEKQKILDMMQKPHMTQVSVAKALGIAPKTVRNTLHRRCEIMSLAGTSNHGNKYHIKVDQKYAEVNDATLLWFNEMRKKHGEIPLVESIVREKATKIAEKLGFSDFEASNGLFRSWKTRCCLESYKVTYLPPFNTSTFVIDAWREHECSRRRYRRI